MWTRALLVWWFGWYLVTADGAVYLPPPDQAAEPPVDSATCEQQREAKTDELVAMFRSGAIAGFEVHRCESLDRAPR